MEDVDKGMPQDMHMGVNRSALALTHSLADYYRINPDQLIRGSSVSVHKARLLLAAIADFRSSVLVAERSWGQIQRVMTAPPHSAHTLWGC